MIYGFKKHPIERGSTGLSRYVIAIWIDTIQAINRGGQKMRTRHQKAGIINPELLGSDSTEQRLVDQKDGG